MNCEDPLPSPPDPADRDHDSCSVQAVGELDTASAGTLLQRVEEVPAACREVVIDLSGVTFMDGAGLDALLAARRTVHDRGGVLRLHSPRPGVRYVLQLSGTEDAFDVTS